MDCPSEELAARNSFSVSWRSLGTCLPFGAGPVLPGSRWPCQLCGNLGPVHVRRGRGQLRAGLGSAAPDGSQQWRPVWGLPHRPAPPSGSLLSLLSVSCTGNCAPKPLTFLILPQRLLPRGWIPVTHGALAKRTGNNPLKITERLRAISVFPL